MRLIEKDGFAKRRGFGALGRSARALLTAAVAALALVSVMGAASIVGFSCITSQASSNCAVGEAQIGLDVFAIPGGAGFTFRNLGPGASSIADVYFQSTLFSGLVGLDNTPGRVEFAPGARPVNLPGGNGLTPAFRATPGLSALLNM